jgi:hypothetical protein
MLLIYILLIYKTVRWYELWTYGNTTLCAGDNPYAVIRISAGQTDSIKYVDLPRLLDCFIILQLQHFYSLESMRIEANRALNITLACCGE